MLKGTTSTANITPGAAGSQLTRSRAAPGPMSPSPSLGSSLASGPLFLLLAVRPVASCLPDSASGSFSQMWQRFLAILSSRIDALTFENIRFTIGKPTSPRTSSVSCLPCSRRLCDAFLFPSRLSKMLLEDVWDAFKLLSGVA